MRTSPPQTWLLVGGAGYIGSHVVRTFQQHGYEVSVFDDFSTGSRNFLPENTKIFTGDIRDSNAVAESLAGVNGVVHLAGYKYASESVKYPEETLDVNRNGTRNLLEQMRITGTQKIIFSSSSSVSSGVGPRIPETVDPGNAPLTATTV